MQRLLLFLVFIVFVAASPVSVTFNVIEKRQTHTRSRMSRRQVGDGVNGNQTNSSGTITEGDGPGDGNGVGFAGTGNDIDTGDDFDIGDGNTTMGDGNTITIGDRITNINLPNLPINMSDIVGLAGLRNGSGNRTTSGDGDMVIDISVRMRIRDGGDDST